MTPLIFLSGIYKTYTLGEVQVNALNGVDLQIKPGEFVAIIGPSGSGKSTLMHIIGLLDKPTKGTVKLEEHAVENLSSDSLAKLRNEHIGFVFQAFNLLPRTSAIENVELPLIYSGVTSAERRRRAIRALELVGLPDRMDHTPSQLSGGQQQRVAIARALVTKPLLILADEPTGNLDSKAGDEIITLLDKLNNEGNTIVVVTHEHEIAEKTKRVIEMKDGVIIKDKKIR